ncbi:MAG: protein kinase [Pirellulales bacterium]|nr:protein kinase [Pirellulales bacterium]
MSSDTTQPLEGDDRRRSQEISRESRRPPLALPGYEPQRLLGMGAFGEVWVAVERNTGRRVAIKFYTHRGGLDWSLLAREVEKLSFLFADRYAVQLLAVGWDAEPPYYVMEYLERGSLAARLQQGPLPVAEAVALFRSVAVGLVHAHDQGVLHCDLKPANILLDRDGQPRLADFGQSRLSTEQAPALGTLFYMAPEQAKLTEAPQARWDVYALGAVLYCMLTGEPPHRTPENVEKLERTEDLDKRLSLYRRMIRKSPAPSRHREIRGVDRALAEIIDRCLAAEPEDRYPDVQAVLAALDARESRRARRPALLLGAIGPAILLAVAAWFAWQGFSTAVRRTDQELTRRAYQTNRFLASNLAELAGNELGRRWRAVGQLAQSSELREALAAATGPTSEAASLLDELSDPTRPERELEPMRRDYREQDPSRATLQRLFDRLTKQAARQHGVVESAGWFLNDARGIQVARNPRQPIIGRNYAWRSYFSGLADDLLPSQRPAPGQHVGRVRLSAVYQSQATRRWIAAISAPILGEGPEPEFLGVVAMMVELDRFSNFEGDDPEQFAALVDWRAGRNQGLILQHPRLDELLSSHDNLPEIELRKYRVVLTRAADGGGRLVRYRDPLSDVPLDQQRWLAEMAPVPIAGETVNPEDCLAVVVQEAYQGSIGQTLVRLKASLVRRGFLALLVIAAVMAGLWTLALRMFREAGHLPRVLAAADAPDPSAPSSRTPGSGDT